MTFKPMYDLEHLTESQREEYYLSACKYFDVPAELNLLAFIYLDSGDGKRNLVLYAKKGATDIIRSNEGISVTKTTKEIGPGYVAWIVEGQNTVGRTEIAVGSAFTEGLKGQSLANAVMIAHTRATRRMTLQFIGGGLLDESEVDGSTTDINRSRAPLASLSGIPVPIQPVVEPNSAPGKDVTPKTGLVEDIPAEPQAVQDIAPVSEPVKRKYRRKKAEINLGEAGIEPTNNETVKPSADRVQETLDRQFGLVPEPAQERIQTTIMPQPVEPPATPVSTGQGFGDGPDQIPVKGSPKEVQWRAGLFKYTEDKKGIFALGGMTERVIVKIKKYAYTMFPGLTDTQNMTNSMWLAFLADLDKQTAQLSPKGLVDLIEKNYLKG